VRDGAGLIKKHLWAEPIIAFGRRRFPDSYKIRLFCYFLTSPIWYTFSSTRIGSCVSDFFHGLRPSVRASNRADYYDQGAGYVEHRSFGGVTDSLETRMPNDY
jgi:hypothetical protein